MAKVTPVIRLQRPEGPLRVSLIVAIFCWLCWLLCGSLLQVMTLSREACGGMVGKQSLISSTSLLKATPLLFTIARLCHSCWPL